MDKLIEELVTRYKEYPARKPWLYLRHYAYQNLQDLLFRSPDVIRQTSYSDFKKHYFTFCDLSDEKRNQAFHFGIEDLVNYLEKKPIDELKQELQANTLKLVGNASWTRLHMAFRKSLWSDVQDAIIYLLFGENNTHLSELQDEAVYERLRIVLEEDKQVKGFGRAKITPLLMICDSHDRFGVWNSVSDDALAQFGMLSKGNPLLRASTNRFQLVNEAILRLKTGFDFENLSDVDIFLWFAQAQRAAEKPAKKVRKSVRTWQKPPVVERPEISTPVFDERPTEWTHAKVQAILLELGNLLGYETYVADPSSRVEDRTLGELVSLSELPPFTLPEILESARHVDVIWFRDYFPRYCFEVEHTTGIRPGLLRLYQLKDLNAKFFILAPTKLVDKFEREVSRKPFSQIRNRYQFRTYDQLFTLLSHARNYYNVLKDFGLE